MPGKTWAFFNIDIFSNLKKTKLFKWYGINKKSARMFYLMGTWIVDDLFVDCMRVYSWCGIMGRVIIYAWSDLYTISCLINHEYNVIFLIRFDASKNGQAHVDPCMARHLVGQLSTWCRFFRSKHMTSEFM